MSSNDLEAKQPTKDSASSQAEGDVHETVHDSRMPESLRGLSREEIAGMNSKLVRKIDLIILPIIMILYILNYIDRQNLAAAKLQGIMEDLNMDEKQFATAISILFGTSTTLHS